VSGVTLILSCDLKILAELLFGPVQANGYGVGGEPEHSGDLGGFELFPRPQVEQFPIGVAEFGEGGVEFGVEGVVAVGHRARLAFGPVDEAEVTAAGAAVV
jgi:hypothetical protein